MSDETSAKLRALLEAFAQRAAKAAPAAGKAHAQGETQRRSCGDRLRTIVRPVLEMVARQLQGAGHEASTRDHTERENAYPSVALSFTPKRSLEAGAALASALIFRFDPRHGVVAHADVKAPPTVGQLTGAPQRLGTIGVDALSLEWVETKTLNFVEAVLKAN
jgi:hypothetical protein